MGIINNHFKKDTPEEVIVKVRSLISEGNEHFRNGKYYHARNLYREALRKDPNIGDPEFWFRMAICTLTVSNDYGFGIDYLDKSLEFGGKNNPELAEMIFSLRGRLFSCA
jgi:tetratricopeptide (TPR) repeat protein